ncbi:WYL domain-containing protein [Shewanella sp. SM34]|uniref:WYL domain-containing protein n=1 Tax=unclassified Shewanella TaxID=196818 RepID=UPI0021D8F763|nr:MULTISPECIES: WYL domain-containing protein [unclassified Shewanella]MCU8058411.1 WYL domain-containing protein [Shewanella sp. SM35]MCU8067363.1 WYL domain-containing protein [Shewanella sp. SM34]
MLEEKTSTRRWGQERRLEFIDFRLQWEGRVNRSDLTEFFRISIPQASLDFSAYQELAPNNMVYDRTEKAYVASDNFKAIMVNPNPYQYLNELLWRESNLLSNSESFVSIPPPIETLPHPYRSVSAETLKILLKAIRENLIVEINYQSMSRPVPENRWVQPRTFAFDGFRWHVRCYCFKDNIFKDYVLGRIMAIISLKPLEENLPKDYDWETFIKVILAPNPSYSDAQRIAIENDFGMLNGSTEVILRKAMLYYFKKRLHLSEPGTTVSENQQIVMLSAIPL